MKKFKIDRFTRVSEPVRTLITKFGGQPVWLTEPQWPLSSGWDKRPMMFIGGGVPFFPRRWMAVW